VIPPRVSFIVVTHARAKRLVGALESIRRQSIADREVIVVVNGPDPERSSFFEHSTLRCV